MNAEPFDQQITALADLAARLRAQAGAEAPLPATPEYDHTIVATTQALERSAVALHVAADALRHQYDLLIAEQSQTEQERRRVRSVFTSAACALVITDASGAIDEANRAAADLLGLSPALLFRTPLAAFISQNDQFHFRRTLARAATTGEAATWTGTIQPRHREPIQASATVAPLADLHAPPPLIWSLNPLELPEGHESGMALRRDLELRTLRRAAELGDASRLQEQLLSAIAGDGQRLAVTLADALQRLRQDIAEGDHGRQLRNLDGMSTVIEELGALFMDARGLGPLRLGRGLNREPVNLTGLVTEAVAAREHPAGACTVIAPATAMIGRWDRPLLRYAVDAAISAILNAVPAPERVEIHLSHEERPGAGAAVLRITRLPNPVATGTLPDPGPSLASPITPVPRLSDPRPTPIGQAQPAGTQVSLTVARMIIDRHGGTLDLTGEGAPAHRAVVHLPMDGAAG